MDGQVTGRRSDQVPVHPRFVTDDTCPIPVVRAYLEGMMPGDGCVPSLKSVRRNAEDDMTLSGSTTGDTTQQGSTDGHGMSKRRKTCQPDIKSCFEACRKKHQHTLEHDTTLCYVTPGSAVQHSVIHDGIPRQFEWSEIFIQSASHENADGMRAKLKEIVTMFKRCGFTDLYVRDTTLRPPKRNKKDEDINPTFYIIQQEPQKTPWNG
ncbi:hypothetical protein GGH92_010019 [Coemansia sp. RSA 2673]|nr:hypothetical protein GGH92_010019 [Coemansia sp. RSA 2673]